MSRWTDDEDRMIINMVALGKSMDQVSLALGRSAGSIVDHCHRFNLPRPSRRPGRNDDRAVDHWTYKTNALAGLRHCKDLREAGYTPGFGELAVTPDGIPYNYKSQVDVCSIYGSSAAACAEIGG